MQILCAYLGGASALALTFQTVEVREGALVRG